MDSRKVKIFTILVLVILVFLTFYATSKQEERLNEQNNKENNNASSFENNSQLVANNEAGKQTENKQDDNPDVITITEEETEVWQYRFPNCYVVYGEETQYNLSGYRYFIIKSQEELKNYLSTKFLSSSNDELIDFNTEEIEEKLNSNFFKTGSVIVLVDYNQNKKIDGSIVDVSILQDELNISLDRKNNSKESSNFVTYIIPIQTRVYKTVKVQYK